MQIVIKIKDLAFKLSIHPQSREIMYLLNDSVNLLEKWVELKTVALLAISEDSPVDHCVIV
jgi:hypothetical protein